MFVASLLTHLSVVFFLNLQRELRNVSAIIAETKEAVEGFKKAIGEVDKVVKTVNHETVPKLNGILDGAQKTLPDIHKAVKGLDDTFAYVKGGAHTASTLFTPVTTAANVFQSIGNFFREDDESNNDKNKDKDKDKDKDEKTGSTPDTETKLESNIRHPNKTVVFSERHAVSPSPVSAKESIRHPNKTVVFQERHTASPSSPTERNVAFEKQRSVRPGRRKMVE